MKFYVYKLGCPKNDVDAEYIAARMVAEGHQPVSSVEKADTVIVHTCGFIQDAKQESIDTILQLAELKQAGKLKTLYASGCLTQRYGDELLEGIEQLDGAFGHGVLDRLAEFVTGSQHLKKTVRQDLRNLAYLDWNHRFLTDSYPYSYLKISDGCDRECSYCTIPLMRGQYRSRSISSIMREAEFLTQNNKKELILVSQEATLWGSEANGSKTLLDLLAELEKLEQLSWIRLLYLHPARTDERLVEHIAANNKTVPYFDLPLQHISTKILRLMKRETNRRTIESLLARIKRLAPHATRRVSFMVGFPGETEGDFQELYDFVEEQQFDRLGGFMFSSEEGTRAADLDGTVPEEVQSERFDRLMSLQREIAFDKNNSLIGKQIQIIIDSVESGREAIGRSTGDSPEIDQTVRLTGDLPQVGDICRARIDAADGYDLVGTLVPE